MKEEITIEEAKPETIVILGAPGSGKDTQAQYLVDALGYQVVSTGELARILAEHNEEVREKMAKGELLPDSLIEDELLSAFVLLPDEQPVILDGYPRNLEQAKKLEEILEENSRKLDKVILINVSEKEAIKRIGKRRVCDTCGRFTSKEEGEKCIECSGKLIEREDDGADSVKRRFALFHEVTEPMIKFFKEKGILAEVNGDGSPESVRESIKEVV